MNFPKTTGNGSYEMSAEQRKCDDERDQEITHLISRIDLLI